MKLGRYIKDKINFILAYIIYIIIIISYTNAMGVDKNVILVKGSVPGPKGAILKVKSAIKATK